MIITACGNWEISTHWGSKTPEQISSKVRNMELCNCIVDVTTHANLCDNVGGMGKHVTCHM